MMLRRLASTSSKRRPLRESSTGPSGLRDPFRASPPLAFAFDIDGVLLQGSSVLPGAKSALSLLEEHGNPFGLKIPFILLTNGGGVGEVERCERLTKQLGVRIDPMHYIQAHTIVGGLARNYENDAVLVVGGTLDVVRRVAEGYGYRNVYTTTDVLAWNPSVWPFHSLSDAERQVAKASVDFSQTRISAIFVFHDPRNWALDVQILCDILQSNGIISGPYVEPQLRTTKLIFCNPDLLWRSDFPQPRLGQGAFKEAFQAVYKALTGATYPYTQYGKPTKATYQFAESRLRNQLQTIYGPNFPAPHVYMIGDNPTSDIAGANVANWSSILVRTGVYDPRQGPPAHRPTHEAPDVEAAVKWAIERELGKAGRGSHLSD